MKKTICSILAIVICLSSMCFPISTTAAQPQAVSATENTQDDRILFSKLFFEKKENIDKVTAYFNEEISTGTIPSLNEIDIHRLINNLNLDTNYDETVCIVKNIISIDEYVDEEKINDATTGISLSDPMGGMLSKIPDKGFGIQPLWDKDTVHRNKTTQIAKKYFNSDVADDIGKANRDVDIKYSSGVGAITGSANQYIHFNEYASGSDDSRDYAAAAWFVACELAWNKGQKSNAYMYLGYALHPLQDKESHGQIDRGAKRPQHLIDKNGDNRSKADKETGWEWTNSKRNALKAVSGSRKRYNAAVSVTETYLKKYKSILK